MSSCTARSPSKAAAPTSSTTTSWSANSISGCTADPRPRTGQYPSGSSRLYYSPWPSATRRVGQPPPANQLLKTIDHAPRSLWAALRPASDGLDREDSWRGKLAELRPRIATVLEALPQAGLSQTAAERGKRTLRSSLGL